MHLTTRKIVGSVAAAVAAMMFVSISPAQAQTGKEPPPPQAQQLAAPDQATGARAAATSAATASALATIQRRIARQAAATGNVYSFGSYVDPATGRIVIETDAPAGVVSSLVKPPGAASAQSASAQSAERTAAARTVVRRTTTSDTYSRRDDIAAFYGGGGLAVGSALCSAGYAVRNSAGTAFMVTAAHCYANGAAVRTESGNAAYGTVSNRRLDSITKDGKDMELIGGQSYAGRVYTGGTTSTTSIPVISAGSAAVGYNAYCHSGRTTGEQCGHTATSTTAQVCTSTGCKSPVIAYTGGTLQAGGDSGGAFYSKNSSGAYIRGHVIAVNSGTGYVEPWTVLQSTYNVTVVTG